MLQQMTESKISGQGHGNRTSVSELTSADRQLPIAAKKTALREIPNENRIITPNASNTPPVKDKVGVIDPIKVSGTKRPSSEMSNNHSPSSNAPNSPLVYVRRKSDTEMGKNGIHDSPISANTGPKVSTQPVSPPITSFPKPSGPSPKPRSANFKGSPSLPKENSQGMMNVHWEERFMKLQQLMRTLEQADQRDYLHSMFPSTFIEFFFSHIFKKGKLFWII